MKVLLLISVIMLAGCGNRVARIVGVQGKNGVSCYQETIIGGINVICGDDIHFISNGIDGIDGRDGIDGEFDGYLELIEVCPLVSGDYKETLLHLNGQYLAFLANRTYKKERLVLLLEDVLYTTTDGRNVSFTIDNDDLICL